jgi:hypothetical protein
MSPAIIIEIVKGAAEIFKAANKLISDPQTDRVTKEAIMKELASLQELVDNAKREELNILHSIKRKQPQP